MSSRGLHKEALAIWEGLGVEAAEREKIEEGDSGELPESVKMKDILAIFGKDAWRQTALGVFLMGMQQLSGIDGVLYVCRAYFLIRLRLTIDSTRLSSSNPQVSRAQPHLFSRPVFLHYSYSL
jgi:hypothetical protein